MLAIHLSVVAVLWLAVPTEQTTGAPAEAETALIGIWKGTARTGGQSAEVAFDIRKSQKGPLVLFMTLPPLHAWRMPVGYLEGAPGGHWKIPDWHVTLKREGEMLTGELGDPRVTFEVGKADALPAERPLPSYARGPEPDWAYAAGAPVWASLASHQGTVYAADTSGRLHAVASGDGSRLWSRQVGGAMYGAPLVTNDAIFVLDDAGAVQRLRRQDGGVVWRVELGAEAPARVLPAATAFEFDFHAPMPVLQDGTLYLSSPGGAVHALEAGSGRVRWRADLKTQVRTTAAVSASHVLVGTLDHHLVALDRRTGREQWRFKATGPITSAPTVADRLVIVASRGSWITALDLKSGAVEWSRYDWFSWIESDGVLADGVYYVGSSDLRAVRALDPRTGRPRWETDVLGWAWGTPALTADTVYIGVASPQKYVTRHEAGLVALDRRTGAVKWRRPIAQRRDGFVSGYPGSVVISGGVLIAPNVDGTLEGYRLPRR